MWLALRGKDNRSGLSEPTYTFCLTIGSIVWCVPRSIARIHTLFKFANGSAHRPCRTDVLNTEHWQAELEAPPLARSVAVEAGTVWRDMTEAQRAPFETLASASKAEYARLKRTLNQQQAAAASAETPVQYCVQDPVQACEDRLPPELPAHYDEDALLLTTLSCPGGHGLWQHD